MMALLSTTLLTSCATDLPGAVRTDFVKPDPTDDKFSAVNRHRDSPVVYVKLDKDILRPSRKSGGKIPSNEIIGPFEMREETLAAALELVMADKNIPMAFQTDKATTNTITFTNLKGTMADVVEKLCSLADLYCTYDNGTLLIKETETFTVSLPPMITDNYAPFVNGLKAITGGQTYVDDLTGSLIYTATQRNNKQALEYFERLRANTAMIIYEIQIWEVQLTDKNQTGIDWEAFNGTIGNYGFDLLRDGTPSITGALGLGAQYTSANLTVDAVLNFLQTQGAVKTVSQPQLTVLSGSKAKLRVGNKQDYISQITRTVGVNTADNVSVATSKLETGLNIEINSAWDNGTVYGGLKIDLQNLIRIDKIDVGTTSIQLPETSDRNLETKIRVRPGDAVIIGGIVEERSALDQTGLPGGSKPIFTTSKDKQGRNTELVFMLRPRVVVYTKDLPKATQLDVKSASKYEPSRAEGATEMLPEMPTEIDEKKFMPIEKAVTESIKDESLPVIKPIKEPMAEKKKDTKKIEVAKPIVAKPSVDKPPNDKPPLDKPPLDKPKDIKAPEVKAPEVKALTTIIQKPNEKELKP
jgi:hypothetical protein